MKNLLKKLIAWLQRLANEGKSDMSEVGSEATVIVKDGEAVIEKVGAEAATIAKAIEADTVKAVQDVFDKGSADNQAIGIAPAAAAPAATAPVATDIAGLLSKIQALLAVSEQNVEHWPEISAVVVALTSDADAAVAKLKNLLTFMSQPVKAIDEIAALAKATTSSTQG